VGLDDLLRGADIVSLHCPMTPETRGLIDAERLALMKPGAVLVNTARGPIVDLDAAADALVNGTIAAAAFDVVDPEPLPAGSPLYGLENVILTPHAAYYSERSVETVRRETLFAAVDVLRGIRPRIVANPAVLERVRLRDR
jgi:D-3-phosphoglycerate dehydrogenase / 2-oxoglutarate reductase